MFGIIFFVLLVVMVITLVLELWSNTSSDWDIKIKLTDDCDVKEKNTVKRKTKISKGKKTTSVTKQVKQTIAQPTYYNDDIIDTDRLSFDVSDYSSDSYSDSSSSDSFSGGGGDFGGGGSSESY